MRVRRPYRVLAWGGAVLLTTGAVLGVRIARVTRSYDDVAAYWQDRARLPGDLLYVALGDSAAQGVGASRPDEGYVGVVARELARRRHATVRVVNLSVTGARTRDVLDHQLPQLAALHPDLVTLDIGANDAGRTPPAVFRAQFDELCDRLPARTLIADVPTFGGLYALPRQGKAATLSAVAREVLARHPQVRPVRLEQATRQLGILGYSGDTFHPSSRGYAGWASAYVVQLD